MVDQGHVFVPQESLGGRAIELLEVSPDLISPALDRLAQELVLGLDHDGRAGHVELENAIERLIQQERIAIHLCELSASA